MIDDPYDALKDGLQHASMTVDSYSDINPSIVYDDIRVMQSVNTAFEQMLTAEAPFVVIRFAVEFVALSEIKRIQNDMPPLTENDVSEIVQDFWRKVLEWIIGD